MKRHSCQVERGLWLTLHILWRTTTDILQFHGFLVVCGLRIKVAKRLFHWARTVNDRRTSNSSSIYFVFEWEKNSESITLLITVPRTKLFGCKFLFHYANGTAHIESSSSALYLSIANIDWFFTGQQKWPQRKVAASSRQLLLLLLLLPPLQSDGNCGAQSALLSTNASRAEYSLFVCLP